MIENNESEIKQKMVLYSTRDIVEKFPNNIGLQKALSQFIMQFKIRPVEHKMIRINKFSTQIRVAYYNAKKLKNKLEDYMVQSNYKLCSDRRQNLNIILELISEKIKIEEIFLDQSIQKIK